MVRRTPGFYSLLIYTNFWAKLLISIHDFHEAIFRSSTLIFLHSHITVRKLEITIAFLFRVSGPCGERMCRH